DAADVLAPIPRGEAEVLAEPMAKVVAVEEVSRATSVHQTPLDFGGQRRLARAGQPREPESGASVPPFLTGHRADVPDDVTHRSVPRRARHIQSRSGQLKGAGRAVA